MQPDLLSGTHQANGSAPITVVAINWIKIAVIKVHTARESFDFIVFNIARCRPVIAAITHFKNRIPVPIASSGQENCSRIFQRRPLSGIYDITGVARISIIGIV